MSAKSARDHFDDIAGTYRDEIPSHVRDHLINKWWFMVSPYLAGARTVVDIGCGDGSNVAFLRDKGLDAVGVDFSRNLLESGIKRNPSLKGLISQADALRLGFPDDAFDAAVMIGVLHHMNSRSEQVDAINEALRVVKDDGVLVIRESNLKNPLFRVFWNYIFPLTAKIDKFGGENWVPVGFLSRQFAGKLERVFYFSFMPNFTPVKLFPLASRIEKNLERSPLRELSAHYTAVLRKKI